jgi:hypothetical protein
MNIIGPGQKGGCSLPGHVTADKTVDNADVAGRSHRWTPMNWMAFARVLRRFYCPRITLIDTNQKKCSTSVSVEPSSPSIRGSNPMQYSSVVFPIYGFSPKAISLPKERQSFHLRSAIPPEDAERRTM